VSVRQTFNPGINPTVLADLPGLPGGSPGSRVDQWLSSWAVGQRMAAVPAVVAAAQELAGTSPPLVPLPTVDRLPTVTSATIAEAEPWPALLNSLVAQGHSASVELADDLGRALGGTVATLVSGPVGARVARPDWPAAHWDSWSRVRRVTVGGGILSGVLGVRMVTTAAAWLSDIAAPVEVVLAHDPASLVLRGAGAGGIPGGADVGLVLDSGGTTIKRAVVSGADSQDRPAAPAPGPRHAAYDLVGILVRAAVEIAPPGDRPLGVAFALATYVDESGQPYADQLGPYAALGQIDLVPELARLLSERLCRPVTVRVRHDGESALLGARLDDPSTDAVIVLGTAVGTAVDPIGS